MLCQEDPGQADYRRWLVETLVDRGELYHMNDRSSDAENDFHAASDQASPLLKLPVPASDHRRAKASALINLSEILTLKNHHLEAPKPRMRPWTCSSHSSCRPLIPSA